jgi:hypothetical protein
MTNDGIIAFQFFEINLFFSYVFHYFQLADFLSALKVTFFSFSVFLFYLIFKYFSFATHI